MALAPSSVICLGLCVRPSAVLRRIRPVYIDSVESAIHVSGRGIVPISQRPCAEGCIIVSPFCADGDASASIVRIIFPSGVVAALLHGMPYAVKTLALVSVLGAPSVPGRKLFAVDAAAGLCIAASESSCRNSDYVSTVTNARPKGAAVFRPYPLFGDQPAESLS